MAHAPTSSVVAALSVYAESLISGARVLVVASSSGASGARARDAHTEEQLLELGARSVHVYDPEQGDPEVRDGAFDLAVVPDLGTLRDAAGVIRRLRRLVDGRGTVIALGRAVTAAEHADADTFPDISPASLGYAQLYDVFALQFESVTMTGVLPFTGVVFAELGGDEDVAVSVDTRLAPPGVPGTFVVVASREPRDLDPYAIVQVEPAPPASAPRLSHERDRESGPALAAAQLKADLLTAQLDELRARLSAAESTQGDRTDVRVERIAAERDVALTRAEELEGVLVAAQQAIVAVEQRFLQAEQAMLERDDLLAALRGELDALRAQGVDLGRHDPEIVAQLRARAEHAESALALNVADLAHVAEAHASETAALEAQLRERARVVAAMEKELGRREQLVRELVASLEEAREANGVVYQHGPALPSADPEEVVRLRRKLDELALEVARREGELVAQQWRIEELERSPGEAAAVTPVPTGSSDASRGADVQGEVAQLRDELDALRQALTQEHAARVAAESGEELSRARAELSRQAALLEQMRARGPHAG